MTHEFLLTFPASEVFLILDGLSKCGHYVLLFKRQDPESFDQSSQPVRCTLPLCVFVALEQQLKQVFNNPCSILFDGGDQRRQTAGNRLLDLEKDDIPHRMMF